MILEILLGILTLILGLIAFVVFRSRKQIGTALNAAMVLRKAQKDFEKELYQREMEKQMPNMIEAKVTQDLQKKLKKKPLAEKLSDMSKQMTKDISSGGKEAKGLN